MKSIFEELVYAFTHFDVKNAPESEFFDFEKKINQLSKEEKINALAEISDSDHHLVALKGLLAKQLGNTDQAIALFTAAIKHHATDWRAYYALAVTLYLTKNSSKIAFAERVLRVCISVNPTCSVCRKLLEIFTFESAFHGDPNYQNIVPLLLNEYKATAFVETGTYLGHSSEFIALQFPGLPHFTTEINDTFFDLAKQRLAPYPHVKLFKKHTLDFLKQDLIHLDLGERPVFFIDAHWEQDWPLIEELTFIKEHYPNAILVVDDMQVPGQPQFPYDNYGGDKVCDLPHIAPVLQDFCTNCLIPTYTAEKTEPYTSLSGYGIFALNHDDFLHEIVKKNGLENDFSVIPMHTKASSAKQDKKIIGLIPVKNEADVIEFTLRALAPFVDSIIVFDDDSTDNTVEICNRLKKQCKIESIITNNQWDYNETYYRQALLDKGRKLGGTHFICLDADEAFTSNLLNDNQLQTIVLNLKPGETLVMHWLQLWRSTLEFRHDQSVWTNNTKVFAFADDGVSNYHQQEFHLLRHPSGLTGKSVVIPNANFGVMHFQFVNWTNLLIKQAWYRVLEKIKQPEKPDEQINALYAPSKDETNLGLRDVPTDWFSLYPFFSPVYFEKSESWRTQQVLSFFKEKGRDYFKGLDIWDVDWDFHAKRIKEEQQEKHELPEDYLPRLMKAPITKTEQHILQLTQGVQGWFTSNEMIALFRLAKKQATNARILEIGSFMGRSTNILGHSCIHTKRELFALDVWLDFGEDLDDRAQSENGIHILNTFIRNTQWFADKLRILKGSTNQFESLLVTQQFDLIFIDAAHDYQNVCNDIRVALTCIKPGGILIGHDYHTMGGEEVIQAVHDSLFYRDDIQVKGVFEGTTIWYAQIPNPIHG